METDELVVWICWVRNRITVHENPGCQRGPGDKSHITCGWYDIKPLAEEEEE